MRMAADAIDESPMGGDREWITRERERDARDANDARETDTRGVRTYI